MNSYYMLIKTIRNKIEDLRIRKAIKSTPLKIVVGASGVFQKGWTPTDVGQLNILRLEDWYRYFQPNSIDVILAEHVWEHLTENEAYQAAKNCYIFMKPFGYIRVAVPDGYHPSSNYIKAVEPGGSGKGSDDHKVLYNYKALAHVFESADFEVKLLEYFDEEGKFHIEGWHNDDGFITRSSRYDERNIGGRLDYTSIIIDAVKAM